MKRPAIKDLYTDALDIIPVDYSWPPDKFGAEDGWNHWTADRCQTCNEVVVGQGESIEHNDADSDSACRGSLSCSPPMMSYFYPLALEGRIEAAKPLVDLPLCVVEVNGVTGLALTGGGMDLSWEICEAFMLLRQLPPFHFARLPAMAGRGASKRDRWILTGCLRTCSVVVGWARGRAKQNRQLRRDAAPPKPDRLVQTARRALHAKTDR